jgi:hypothetical protein
LSVLRYNNPSEKVRRNQPEAYLSSIPHFQSSDDQQKTHVNHLGFQGITVGQAHLLDEIIDNLELELLHQNQQSPDVDRRSSSSFYQSKTFTYALGSNHDLFDGLWSRQETME